MDKEWDKQQDIEHMGIHHGNHTFMFTWNVILSVAVIYLLLKKPAIIAMAQVVLAETKTHQEKEPQGGPQIHWLWVATWLT